MANLEDRLKQLEENFGLGGDLKEKAEKAGDYLVLMAYKEGDCPERFIPRAKNLIGRYGNLEMALKACGDVDLDNIDRAMAKEEREEQGGLKNTIFG